MNKIKDLVSVIELDKTPEIYKAFPCHFFQNENLSSDAMALGGHLHSRPNGWTPRPYDIKKRFGWGKHKWNKACGELRKEGYMYLLATPTGSRLYFSIEKNPPQQINKVIPLRNPLSENRTVAISTTYPQPTVRLSGTGKPDCLKGKKDIRSIITTNIVPTNPKDTHMRERKIDVDEKLVFELKENGVGSDTAAIWIKQYGSELIREKLELLSKQKNVRDPAAWLASALRNNYSGVKELRRNEPRRMGEQAKTHLSREEYGDQLKQAVQRLEDFRKSNPDIRKKGIADARAVLDIENSKVKGGTSGDRTLSGVYP